MLLVESVAVILTFALFGANAQTSASGTLNNICRTLSNTPDICSCTCRPALQPALLVPISGSASFASTAQVVSKTEVVPQAQARTLPAPPPPPPPPAAIPLIDRIFEGSGPSAKIHCPTGTKNGWFHRNWTVGAIRPYYRNLGKRASIEECVQICDTQFDCFFATFTATQMCYFLTTTDPAGCKYVKSGHYDTEIEQCTVEKPCPSAYKICDDPKCSLEAIKRRYCIAGESDKSAAVATCKD